MIDSQAARHSLSRFIPGLLFLVTFAVYAFTTAPATLFGDPSEYQFIPAILGIAHPPGYAFYTLLAKLWQTIVPVGSLAFRTNLLSAAVGAWVVTAVYLIVRDLQSPVRATILAALFAALSLAATPDLWQHAVHSNGHIVSAAFAITHLWLLTRWWRTGSAGWLAALALTVGLAATHHPVTLLGVPAYTLFVLVARPRTLRRGRVLLLLTACFIVGLLPLLYYPLRSPSAPFGPTDMRTWEGFWRHTTAKGLRVNFFRFGLADQPTRAQAFWSLLRLQFPLPTIALILVGLFTLLRRAPQVALLVLLFLLAHLLFTLNFYQDIMAYLVIPFAALAISAGLGALALSELLARALRTLSLVLRPWSIMVGTWLFALFLLLWPTYQAALNLKRGISMWDFTAAEEYVAALHERFAGRGEGAVLLSDWEHLTPVWVHIYTQGEELEEADVKLVYVSTANPWVPSVWQHIEEGPIYLPDYRPSVRDEGFRLVPDGAFYRVVAPPVTDAVPTHPLDMWVDGQLQILGYDLPEATVQAGEPLVLVLYQRVVEPLEGIWMPYARLGSVEARWTTDSRLLSTQWLPEEVVVERYEVPVPFGLPAGEYPLYLGYADLTGSRPALPLSTGGTTAELATIAVLPNMDRPSQGVLSKTLADLDNQVALVEARVRVGWETRRACWQEPVVVEAGRPIHLTLTWRALSCPRDSYKVFVHLIDGADRPVLGHDDFPLGGAFPTYLWFPKWLPGQIVDDPYRLTTPPDLPPGDYRLEVGMYGMTSLRRLPVVDLAGNLAGDRVILGPVRVE